MPFLLNYKIFMYDKLYFLIPESKNKTEDPSVQAAALDYNC